MKRYLFLFFALFAAIPLAAEHLFLKDGSIIECTVVNETANTITIKDTNKKIQYFARPKVLRVIYSRININKVFVQQRNGQGMLLFLVDEDRDTYTFRRELNKPEEFKVNRSDILFITERNIAGLKGEPEYKKIMLSWFPPFDKVTGYRIYTKKNKNDSFVLAATSRDTKPSFLLKKVNSNTRYYLMVTSIDVDSKESPPSNEIEVLTKNYPPEKPGNALVTTIQGEGVQLSWDKASDADGTVTKYRIYRQHNGATSLIAETGELFFKIKNTLPFELLLVTAVDDRGDESATSVCRTADMGGVYLSFQPGFLYPLGKLHDLSGYGYGGSFSLEKRDLFFLGLDVALNAGFYYITGKDAFKREGQNTLRVFLAPLTGRAGWRFMVTPGLSISPFIAAGGLYYDMAYQSKDRITHVITDKRVMTFGPIGEAGLSFQYRVSESWHIGMQATYGIFIRTGNFYDYSYIKGELSFSYLL